MQELNPNLNNIPVNLPLLEDFNDQEVILVDKLYHKAYNHFQIVIVFSGIYSFLKIVLAPLFIAFDESKKY